QQNNDLQIDLLRQAGCERIFEDKASGALDSRPGLIEALEFVRRGDTLCVFRLDRLGRSLSHLISTMNQLKERGVAFKSLNESLDTSTPTGRLMFHIIASLSEFERSLIRERAAAGLAAARARGRIGGRPKKMDAAKLALARTLMASKTIP